MSSKNTISTGSKKNEQTRSCLAVVEADGLFDGRRRVRLPVQSTSIPLTNDNATEENENNGELANARQEEELLTLKQSLANALELPSTTEPSWMEIELYDSTTQSFRNLTRIGEIPSTCCRLRITICPAEKSPSKSTRNNSSNSNDNIGHQRQDLLALPWREFSSSIDLDGKLVLKGGKHSITIQEVSNSGLGTGTNIWDGAIALAKFLEFHDRDDEHRDDGKHPSAASDDSNVDAQPRRHPDSTYSVRGKRVLELGAGTGLVGIAAHVAFGAKEVVLTDLEYSLDNLRENLRVNACRVANDPAAAIPTSTLTQPSTIDAMVLDWFDLTTCDQVLERLGSRQNSAATTTIDSAATNSTEQAVWSPEVILAADVVWVESLVRPLVQTLHRVCTKASLLCSGPQPPLILLSYQRRSQAVEDLLFRTLGEFSFCTQDVTSPFVATTSGAESKIRIYRITHSPAVD